MPVSNNAHFLDRYIELAGKADHIGGDRSLLETEALLLSRAQDAARAEARKTARIETQLLSLLDERRQIEAVPAAGFNDGSQGPKGNWAAHPAQLAAADDAEDAALRQQLARRETQRQGFHVEDSLAALPWSDRLGRWSAQQKELARAYETKLGEGGVAEPQLNPAGRTGRRGQGRLPKLGRNIASVILITRLSRADEDRVTREGHALTEVLLLATAQGWILPGDYDTHLGMTKEMIRRMLRALQKRPMARRGWPLARVADVARRLGPHAWPRRWQLRGIDQPLEAAEQGKLGPMPLGRSPLRHSAGLARPPPVGDSSHAHADDFNTFYEVPMQLENGDEAVEIVVETLSPAGGSPSGVSSATVPTPGPPHTPGNAFQRRLLEEGARTGSVAASDMRRMWRRQYEQR